MTGIQRFIMLVLCVGIIMICFPDFGSAGWTFAGTLILVWTGVILIMSVIGSLFALYRYEGINRFLSWVFLVAVLASVLWLLPQDDKVSPINKLKYGQLPTGADIKRGINKFTFNFDFNRRNANSEQNFVNQKELVDSTQHDAPKRHSRKISQQAVDKVNAVINN